MTAPVRQLTSHATPDGLVRTAQADVAALAGGPWNGDQYSYIPTEPLSIAAGLELHEEFDHEIDPITYQVLRHRFWHKNLEHGDVIQRVSGSAAVVYAYDFAVSLLTENGDCVVVGPSVQYFTALSDLIVKWTLERRSENPGIEDRDVFLQNDPFIGTAQQQDTAAYSPLFWEGRLFCWIYNCAHVGDLGGVDPGSFTINGDDVFSEPTVIPPIKVARRGELQLDVLEMFARQSREPGTITLNVKSMVAGIRAMRGSMCQMLERYGPRVVKGVMRRMIADCSQAVGRRLMQIPDGTWREALYVSGTPEDRVAHREMITLHKRGDQIICTNEGTAPQGGFGNSTYSVLRSIVVAAVGCKLAHDQLYCTAGVANHIVFEPVPGTRNVAHRPAACSAIISTLVGCSLATLVTSKMVLAGPPEIREHANAAGGMALPLGFHVHGVDRDGNFVFGAANGPDVILGCIGAFPFRDGVATGGAWWLLQTTAGNTEESEQSGVAITLYRNETVDSGGPGRWRGGNGGTYAWIPHKATSVVAQNTFIDPGANTCPGLGGGYHGLAGNQLRVSGERMRPILELGEVPRDRAELEAWTAGALERLHPRALVAPSPFDCFIVEYNGGGGYGDPLDREAERVRDDVRRRDVSTGGAAEHYGVILGDDGEIDAGATEARRARLRAERLDDARCFGGWPTAQRDEEAVVVLAGAAGGVDVVVSQGSPHWACSHCGQILGLASENFKLATAYKEHNPHDIDVRMYPDPGEFGDGTIVLRQYFCPDCGTLLGQEFCKAGDDPLFDFRIESLEATA